MRVNYLDTGVQEVDALGYLKVTTSSFVERLQVRITLKFAIRVKNIGQERMTSYAPKRLPDVVVVSHRHQVNDEEGNTGESRTLPTELMLVLRRKSSPIFIIISCVHSSVRQKDPQGINTHLCAACRFCPSH